MLFYDTYQEHFLKGDFYRLVSPFEGNINHVSMMVKYKKEIILGAYQLLYQPNAAIRRIQLQGLDNNKLYLDEQGVEYSGAYLMNTGYPIFNTICGCDNLDYDKVGESDFSSSLILLTEK
ncbi:MAG: GH36 C-terminal domain-containing protein [Lactovum sp.]